ncbi:hypothetical protein DO97_07970 [Neosynechococcus sphagnicola sy1]|uniref:Uncharacterized protein n=1 Tax=Neosynechococcus sphagnicola sy1 TaxID=1497020 RepID=A0A098TKW4_9CYAN|nr:hypothetical protein [Neosynechococcus sphagnicola]KGF72487.1 hypothetical protein DO97_07970 [Neosynechococcus sphagnicola sy1]
MTAFSTSDIPSSINSLEKLAVWVTTILNELYPGTTAIEASGQAARVAEAGPFLITAVDPQQWRHIARISIPLNDPWRRGNAKIWTFAQDIGSASIPTEYKS